MKSHLVALLVASALIPGFTTFADCPSESTEAWIWRTTLKRDPDNMMAFGFQKEQVSWSRIVAACVYDQETNAPIEGLVFYVIPYKGEVDREDATGPKRSDLSFFNPTAGALKTAGPVIRVESTATGQILDTNLPPGQYALVPDWETTSSNDIRVDYIRARTLAVDLPIGPLSMRARSR